MGSNTAALVISMVVAAATAFVVGRATARDVAPAGTVPPSLEATLRDVGATLEDIRRLLADRPVLATAPPAVAEARAAQPPATRAGSSAGEDPPAGTRSAPPADATGPVLAAADLSRAKEIHAWESNEEVRRRWFLVSEAEVLAVFGTPHAVMGWESGERWEYANEDWNLSLCFLRGRLVNVYSTDKRR